MNSSLVAIVLVHVTVFGTIVNVIVIVSINTIVVSISKLSIIIMPDIIHQLRVLYSDILPYITITTILYLLPLISFHYMNKVTPTNYNRYPIQQVLSITIYGYVIVCY